MRVPYPQLKAAFESVLLKLSFPKGKAECCAEIFANNSRDGVASHGLNRFPVFVELVKEGLINPTAEPKVIESIGNMEHWDGFLGPGMYNATVCMDRAIQLAKTGGISCITIRNNNHWMRGGTYGWQAAEAGCIGICFTNAIAGMPAWGGTRPVLGNNPLVIAVPSPRGHIVLDMAMSQFSYGKMQEYQLRGEQLPIPGGYDQNGHLVTDPETIRKTKRALPVGYWKGSGLSLLLDILLTTLSGGRSTAVISQENKEVGLSQCFICLHQKELNEPLIQEIISFTKSSGPQGSVYYPGEKTLARRIQNDWEGVPVDEKIWEVVKNL